VDDEHYFSSRFNEEWFWVLGYGTTAVLVIVANTLMLCSITKNAFLHTNTHRSFALLATRNILRAMYGLSVVYTSRWTHPHGKTNQDTIQVHSSKVKLPLVCDIMCTMDIFFLALPMFIMVGLSIHMFTRAPSPHFNPFPVDDDYIGPTYGTRRKIVGSSSLEIGLMPKEPLWLSFLLPILPILASGLIATPVPLLHFSHKLQALPEKYICLNTNDGHLTYDLSVFILTFCLPLVLIVFLTLGLILRRCVHCSCRHCCNSWCKEEFVVVVQFIFLVCVHLIMYLPMLDNLISKLGIQQVKKYLDLVMPWLPSYATRAIEMTSGFSLPILCYTFLPAYRKFCNDPDPDDLKLSKPKASCEMLDKADAVLTSVKTKSVDSNLDFIEEEAEYDSKRSYEDL